MHAQALMHARVCAQRHACALVHIRVYISMHNVILSSKLDDFMMFILFTCEILCMIYYHSNFTFNVVLVFPFLFIYVCFVHFV